LRATKTQREPILQQFESPKATIGNLHRGTANTALVYHLKPLSRGSVAINLTDPLAPVIIDFRTATDPTDIQLFIALFRKNRQLFLGHGDFGSADGDHVCLCGTGTLLHGDEEGVLVQVANRVFANN